MWYYPKAATSGINACITAGARADSSTLSLCSNTSVLLDMLTGKREDFTRIIANLIKDGSVIAGMHALYVEVGGSIRNG